MPFFSNAKFKKRQSRHSSTYFPEPISHKGKKKKNYTGHQSTINLLFIILGGHIVKKNWNPEWVYCTLLDKCIRRFLLNSGAWTELIHCFSTSFTSFSSFSISLNTNTFKNFLLNPFLFSFLIRHDFQTCWKSFASLNDFQYQTSSLVSSKRCLNIKLNATVWILEWST